MLKEPLLLRQNQPDPDTRPIAPKSSRATHSRLAHPPTISTLRETAQPRTSTHSHHTYPPTATAHRPTEPRTSTHSHCTSTHRATHILAQATAHAPRSRSALCHPAMLPYKRASQPLGTLPPCNATLQTRLAAARRSASLQCSPKRGLLRRPRASGANGSRAAAGAEPAVVASSVVAESAVLLAVTTSWLLVASWFNPPRHHPFSRLPRFCLPHAPRSPRLPTVGGWSATRTTPPLQSNPAFASHGQGIIRP